MCPFAGVGVNVGMEDALQLARRVIAHQGEGKDGIALATKEYELEMFVRAKQQAAKTWEYTGVFFNPIGAEYMVEYFGAIKAKEEAAKFAGKKETAGTELTVAADVHG